MTDVNQVITEHLDIWTSAIERKSGAGRGNGGGISLYGIKKLRELMLELAVRGKLVPQDESDEPAVVLLERLRNRQTEMYEEGVIKKQKPLVKVKDVEVPFELPAGWAWCRISQLGHDWGQKVPDAKFTYIDVGSINKELGLVSDPSVLAANEAPSRARKLVRQGTVIYSTVRPYLLNIAVVTNEFVPEPIASTAFAIIHPFDGVSASYLYRYLRSPTFISYVEGCQTGVAYPAINDKQFFAGLVPLPPTAEQHRIVAKVDELMGLCDTLEAQTEDSLKAHQTLVETCLAALTNSQTPEDLAQNWARLEANFDALFTTEESIKSLREAILEWAVRGLLSETSAADTDPIEFLQKNLAARSELQKKTGDARLKKCASALFEEYRAPLPASWSAASFDELFLFIDYRGRTPKKTERGTPLITAKNVRMGQLNREPREYVFDSTYVEWMTRGFPRIGDLFFTTEAPLANVCINDMDEPFALAQRVICLQPISQINTKYIEIAIRSKPVQEMIDRNGTGMTAKGIKASKLKPLAIPFPPIEEQDRIVDKVQQLDAICDRLASSLRQAEDTKLNLADGLVRQASEIAA